MKKLKPGDRRSSENRRKQRSGFFRRNLTFILFSICAVISTALLLGIFLQKLPAPAKLGFQYMISKRTEHELLSVLGDRPHVVGGLVTRYRYAKNESPVIFSWARKQNKKDIVELVKRIADRQAGDGALSSDEAKTKAAQNPTESATMLRYSEEAKQGLIKCTALDPAIIQRNPGIDNFSKGICYTTIPPFDGDTFLAVVVFIDVNPETNTVATIDLRRQLLQLQIDIFNREFQGLETWISE